MGGQEEQGVPKGLRVKPNDELAKQYLKWGDAIAGFSVLQSVGFAYLLLKGETGVRENVRLGWPLMLLFIAAATAFYIWLARRCASREQELRTSAGHGEVVVEHTKAASRGRRLIILLAGVLSFVSVGLTAAGQHVKQHCAVPPSTRPLDKGAEK